MAVNQKSKIIAEIGWNHMGNMNLAKKMIKSAKNSGADYCKFQTWSVKNLKSGPWDNDGRKKIYKKAELNFIQYKKIIKFCKNNNVKFLTSVFSVKDLELLKKLKLTEIKIPSHEIYNLDLIKKCTKIFKKVFVSAGAAYWKEILKIKKLNKKNIIFMHCVSSYPCEAKNVNFSKFYLLKKLSKEIGYSGHLKGIYDGIAAISIGANYIEKHFTINNKLPGRDNKNAILPKDLKRLSDFRDTFYLMNINRGRDLQSCEKDIYSNYRGRWNK